LSLTLFTCQTCWNTIQNIFYCNLRISKGGSQCLNTFLSWETHTHKFIYFIFKFRIFLLWFLLFLLLLLLGFYFLLWFLLFLLFYFWNLLFLTLWFLMFIKKNTLIVVITTKKSLSLMFSFYTVSSFCVAFPLRTIFWPSTSNPLISLSFYLTCKIWKWVKNIQL